MNDPHVESRRWFYQARADLDVARTLQDARHFAAACFHCQQASEKALKAVLYSQGARVVLGHAVADLARQCEAHDSSFANRIADGNLLDQFYIPTRYPNGLPTPSIPSESYSESQSITAMEAAERVIGAAESFLRDHTDALG